MGDTFQHSFGLGIALHAAENGAPDWMHVVPLGTFSGVDGRGPYVVEDADALVSLFRKEGKKLAVDENHSTDLAGKQGFSAPARGWIVELETRSDGIWGRVDWTPEGKALMQGKSYGFVSPVLHHTAKRPFKVERLLRVALTNDPNLSQLKALHSAQKGSKMDEDQIAALRAALGLADDADATAIVAAVEALKTSRNSADPALFVPISMFQETLAELNKVRSGVSLQSAQRIVDQAVSEGQIMPFMKDWAVSLCQSNASAFNDFLAGAGKPITNFAKSLMSPAADWAAMQKRLDDRSERTELTEIDRQLGHSAEDVKTYGAKSR